MKECRYCHWQFYPKIEDEKSRKEANVKGFCGVACQIAWDAEREYALRREIGGK